MTTASLQRVLLAAAVGLMLCLQTVACSRLRSEFYRAETNHRYREASTAYRAGNTAAARAGFLSILKMDPRYACAQVALGHLSFADRDYEAATVHYRRALAVDASREPDVAPMLVQALDHRRRVVLSRLTFGLDLPAQLMAAGAVDTLDDVLADPSVPLEALAGDSRLLPADRLAALLKASESAGRNRGGAPRTRLFWAWLLYHHRFRDRTTAALLDDLPEQLGAADRPSALLLQGRVLERLRRLESAAAAYRAAVDAGLPPETVTPRLALIYHLPPPVVMQVLRGASPLDYAASPRIRSLRYRD